MTETTGRTVRVGHSPDPDDAFMFYGLAAGKIDTEGLRIEQVLEDIESLNRRALAGELEVTAVSIHAYAHLADRYALMSCGASMGDGYGPCVVARPGLSADELGERVIAVPGTLTSAFLALELFLGRSFPHETVRFDEIPDVVAAGHVDAGLLIHEGQLTYDQLGLVKLVDLGSWWAGHNDGLPLPLGGNAVRRDLGAELMGKLTRLIRESIDYGLQHRDEALDYALPFGRGLDRALADRFVGMYVNDRTRDHGTAGRQAIRRFLDLGADRGFVPRVGAIDFVDGEPAPRSPAR